jgi:hypothetical protein
MATTKKTVVYLDWDTARRLDPKREKASIKGIERTFDLLQVGLSEALSLRDRRAAYRVYWRVYHGWHQGKTKTADRRLFEEYVRSASARTVRNVSFSTDFSYSGDLACVSRRAPIFDTLRFDRNTGTHSQKMVDTMLVCDLLHSARSKEYSLHVVVANDDDTIPALFTAEAWRADVLLLHSREEINQFLQLDGIASRMMVK